MNPHFLKLKTDFVLTHVYPPMVSCVVSLFLQAIPKEAFVKDLSAATYYLVRDLAGAALGLAGLFAIQDLELQPVAYWSASAFCWMIEGEAVSFFPLPI